MLTIVRLILSAVVLTLFAAGIDCLCYRPYVCNRTTRIMKESTSSAWESAARTPDTWRIVLSARRRLDLLQECLDRCSASVDPHMIAAANLRLLNRNAEAASEYREALRYDRRPEIYFNLGLTEVAGGQREQGIEDLVTAGRTGSYWNQIEDEAIRTEVVHRLFYLPAPRF